MSTSGSANAQAQVLLKTLCKCMLPLMKAALEQTTGLENFRFGSEADEVVVELEKFISRMISRSQPRDEDIAIEARLGKNTFYHSEDISIPGTGATLYPSANDQGHPGDNPTNQSMVPQYTTFSSVPLNTSERGLQSELRRLRKHVTQKMPIRLLCFRPENSKLKITLLDRDGIYKYLANNLRARFNEALRPRFIYYKDLAKYAILSHTWDQTPGELTYGDWQKGSLDAMQPKCRKLVNFCKAARENHGITLGWIDTVCINKDSSAELDESIRSMYAWYQNAEVCITYLAGSKTIAEMRYDRWFARGWTLQELVAPECIKFYNMYWNQLSQDEDDKKNHSILEEIRLATTITPDELQHSIQSGTSISRRMQLVAKREVTREEDIAYCLMGIFDVSISTAYGEGAGRAFFRLVEEIFRSTKDVSDIFNWAGGRDTFGLHPTSLFPFHPSNYLNRSENQRLRPWRPIEPLTLTHLGLRIPILLMPALPLRKSASQLSPYQLPIGDYHATVSVDQCYNTGDSSDNFLHYQTSCLLSENFIPNRYLILDQRAPGPQCVQPIGRIGPSQKKRILTFGTLNVEIQGSSTRIPKTCLAVLLKHPVGTSFREYTKVYTDNPIVFDLNETGNNSNDNGDEYYYQIEGSQLANHGMQLVTLYL